ncbi:hypothetical protein ACLMJK_006339 [Lecanora helva]
MIIKVLYIFLYFVVFLFVSVTPTNISLNIGFDRHVCYLRTLDYIGNHTLPSDDPVFFRNPAGQPLNTKEDLTLTLDGCNRLCGPKRMWYQDIGPRLSIWLIPVLLLISNVELSPLDKRRFAAILHLLGDPIDSLWSLLHKLDSWDRCLDLAEERYGAACPRCQRIIATIFAGFEEMEGPRIKSERYFDALVHQRDPVSNFQLWRQTAVELADSRTDEFARSAFAIFLYAFQLIANFVKELGGGSSSPPGGRIATGVFLSWLLPMVLLSNAIGNFPARRTCYDALSRFAERMDDPLQIPRSRSVVVPSMSMLTRTSWTDYSHSLGWSGAIYTFRPWKWQHVSNSSNRRRTARLIFLLAITPLCIGFMGGFAILWYSLPVGLNCRHTWLCGIFLAWSLSTFLTWYSYRPQLATGKFHWRFVLVKDTCIAVPSLLVIFLSACGVFNFCYCWGGFLFSPANANVPLNSDSFYKHNDRTTYPAIVGVCTAFQLVMFGVIVWIWRRGLKILRWSEKVRSEEWAKVSNRETCNRCILETELSRPDAGSAGKGSTTYIHEVELNRLVTP